MTIEGLKRISDFASMMDSDDYIIRIMKQNYIPNITTEDFEQIELPQGVERFFCEYSGANMVTAYEPFLNVLREIIGRHDIDIDELLDECDIYSLLKNVFKSYIETGVVRRTEKLLLSERDYEKGKFISGLVKLLLKVTETHRVFILINNTNHICESTLDVLERLLGERSHNLKVLMIVSESGNVKQYIKIRLNSFIEKNDMTGLVIDGAIKDVESDRKKEQTFNFKSSNTELEKIDTMMQTFAFEQAEYYISMIYQKVELEKVYVTLDFRIKMLSLYISISIYSENYSYALMLCDKYKTFNGKETERMYQYHYYSALANTYLGNNDAAQFHAAECKKVAEEIDDEYTTLSALLLENMVRFSGWKDIWICADGVEVPEKLLKLCKKYNYMNHMAHILVYSYHNSMSIYENPNDIESRIPNTLRGVEIANKLRNYSFLLEAYRKCVMMASYNGNYDTASYFYTKSIEIVKKTNNKKEEVDIYNGMGYDSCTADRFEEANEYYNDALEILYEEKDTDAVLETLYNMGTNALLAGDYNNSEEYLTAVFNILKVLKRENIRVCNISKILGMISVAAYKRGSLYAAQVYNGKAKQFLSHILEYKVEDFENYLWGDDVFLYYYSCAIIAMTNKKYTEAMEYFDKSEEFLIMSTGSMFMNLIFYAMDRARLNRILGNEEEAVRILTSAKDFYVKHKNPDRIEMLDCAIQNKPYNRKKYVMDMKKLTIDQIIEFVRLKEGENELTETKKQLSFFGDFQELVNSEYISLDHMISSLIVSFKTNFKLDDVVFINFDEHGEAEIKYSDLEYDLEIEQISEWIDYFNEDADGFVLSKFSNNYSDFKNVIDVFDRSKISSIIVAPIYRFEKVKSIFITFNRLSDSWNSAANREVLDEKDKDIYMIVFRQIVDAIEKYKLNDRLKQQAVTDELTGLLNRNGYYRVINKSLANARKENRAIDISVIYIDLDHFKYYNDTFGHHVGDMLLKRFGEIFAEACEDYGEAIRFGGDEFIIIVNNAEKDIIQSIVDKIYDSIEKENGFEKFVRKYTDEDIQTIPKEYRLTCSIGIDLKRGIVGADDYSIVRKHADVALYYGKRTTRGCAIWYEEMEKLKK